MYPTARTFPGDPSGLPFGRFGWRAKPAGNRVWFVDGLSGRDGGEGDTPEDAFATIGKAISKAGAFDVIYVLDRGLSGTDPNPYQEASANLSIPYAKSNLALIGVPHNINYLYGLQIKGHASAVTAVLNVKAPFCTIENLSFNRGGSTTGGIYFDDEGDTTDQAQGSSVYNCYFRNLRGAGNGSTGAAIVIDGGWNYFFGKSIFYNCRGGVVIKSSAASTVQGVVLDDLTFMGDAASIDTDIHMSGVIINTLIDKCKLAHAKPTWATGLNKYVILVGASSMFSNNFVAKAAADTFGAAGSVGTVPTTFFMVGNYDEGGILARTP